MTNKFSKTRVTKRRIDQIKRLEAASDVFSEMQFSIDEQDAFDTAHRLICKEITQKFKEWQFTKREIRRLYSLIDNEILVG